MTHVTHLLSSLNDQQKKAVLHENGPAIVLAGAGSGKTRVLTTRATWLIKEKHVRPEEILLVTFTNKAAGEMNRRVYEQAGTELPFSGTFHSLCSRILRKEAHHLGLTPSYSIYDSGDQLSLIKQLYKKHGYDSKKFKPQAIKAKISQAKNEMLTPDDYAEIAGDDYQEFTAKLYRKYQTALHEQQAADFDDLLLLVVKLFQENKAVLEKYQNLISYVMVDEYQDTNKAQYHLTKFFSQPQNNLYVVGDFSQSIYAWRGADYRNLMNLKQDFDKIDEYRLEQNYRSTQTILDAATQVISGNSSHPILKLWTDKPASSKIQVIETHTNETEASRVLQIIKDECPPFEYRDIAILYRTNAQSRAFEEAFMKSGIPYKLVGGVKFYERKEIKDVLAYLRLIVNPADTVSIERAMKLGKRRFSALQNWLNDQAVSFANEMPFSVLEKILKVTTYLDKFDEKDPDDQTRIENIQELLNVASQFNNITEFLENVALVQDGYFHSVRDHEFPNSVTMMSLHSAKGLEFPIVFVVGMEEGLLPHSRSLWDKAQMEEERRLCYVGITRAKEKLFFTYARTRWQYGKSSSTVRSRFLSEIDSSLLDESLQPKKHDYKNNIKNSWGGGNNWNDGNDWEDKPYNYSEKKKKPPSPKKLARKLVLDDDTFDALMNDEMDIKAFLDS